MIDVPRASNPSILRPVLILALGLSLLVLSAWLVYTTLTGVNSIVIWDFHPPWTAIHAMLREGVDPYGQSVLTTIQEQMLGRIALPGEDQFAFVYPLYILVLMGPLAYMSLSMAQAVWLALLEAGLMIFVLLAPRAVGWRPPRWLSMVIILSSLGLYSTVWALWLGQVSIVVAAFIAVAWWSVRTRRWVLAGMCLALSTVKPQMVFLFVPGVLLWATYQRHWRLIIAFAVALGLLILLPMPWQPAWPLAWIQAVQNYAGYTVFEPPLVALLSSTWLSAGIAGLLIAWTVYRWWRAKQGQGATPDWALSMLLVISALIAPRSSHVNQLVLLLPLFYVYSRTTRPGIVFAVGMALLLGPWLLDYLAASPLGSPDHMLWQHRLINPILPLFLATTLLALSPRGAKGELQ